MMSLYQILVSDWGLMCISSIFLFTILLTLELISSLLFTKYKTVYLFRWHIRYMLLGLLNIIYFNFLDNLYIKLGYIFGIYCFCILLLLLDRTYTLIFEQKNNYKISSELSINTDIYFRALLFQAIIIFMYMHSMPEYIAMRNSMICIIGCGFFCFAFPQMISKICVSGSLQVSEYIKHGLSAGFNICAFNGWVISAMCCWAFYLSSFGSNKYTLLLFALTGFIYQVTGGIFTKGADIGADLAGKTQFALKEDDSKNPGSLADNIGDLIGDCLGISLNALTVLALLRIYGSIQINQILFIGLIGSAIGYIALWIFQSRSICVYLIINLILYYITIFESQYMIQNLLDIVLILGIFMFPKVCSGNYVAQYISRAAKNGAGLAITAGIGITFMQTSILTYIAQQYISTNIIAGFVFLLPSIISLNAIGAIADNAGGIVEMSDMPYRHLTDELDSDGNTTKASVKSMLGIFGIMIILQILSYDMISTPYLMNSILGICVAIFFCNGLLIYASKFAGESVLNYIQDYIKQNPKILTGEQKPNPSIIIQQLSIFASCFCILLLSIIGLYMKIPLIHAKIFGILGFMFSIQQIICGGLWDTTKKSLESQKNSDELNSAIQCDIVGDTYKDVAGPGMLSISLLVLALAI